MGSCFTLNYPRGEVVESIGVLHEKCGLMSHIELPPRPSGRVTVEEQLERGLPKRTW